MSERRKREELRADLVGPARVDILTDLQRLWQLPSTTATVQRLIDWAGERMEDRGRREELRAELDTVHQEIAALMQRRQALEAQLFGLDPVPERPRATAPEPPPPPRHLGAGRFRI